MIEIIGKIVLCLVVALLLGFLIGWLFSKALGKQEEHINQDTFAGIESTLNMDIAELKVKYEKEKSMVADYSLKNRELKGELMKKISLLESTSDTLKSLQKETITKQDNKSDFTMERVTKLEKLLDMKSRELAEFETVLLKAEETIENLRNK